MASDLIKDPVGRLRFNFDQVGDVLRMEFWADPGAKVERHLHPAAEERFEILAGDIVFVVDREERPVTGGDSLVVAPGTWHQFWNPSPTTAHFVVELEPGDGFEQFFCDSAALSQGGFLSAPAKPRGWRGLLAAADFAERYRHLFLAASPPPFLQRLTIPAAARLARARGHVATPPEALQL